jgi:hypothetical protein
MARITSYRLGLMSAAAACALAAGAVQAQEVTEVELKAMSTILAKPFEVREAALFTVARSGTGAGDLTQI